MKKVVIILVVAVVAITGFIVFYFVASKGGKAEPAGAATTAATDSVSLERKQETPGREPNPWEKSLSVSSGDIGSIASTFETVFDRGQMRRRLVLGFWRQGYKADQIAVITGYDIDNVLKAMETYEEKSKRRKADIERLVYEDVDIIEDHVFPGEKDIAALKGQPSVPGVTEGSD